MMMKRFLMIALAAVMLLSLCACGADDPDANATDPTKDGNVTPSTTPVGYTFTYNDYQFGVNMAVEAVLKQLGEPVQKLESESCAFGGKDTVYYYDGIQISSNDEDGYDRIYSIYLESDLVSTEKNICIGDSADKVKSAYGEPGEGSTETNLVYTKDGMTLSFNLKDGTVSSILYNDPA